MTWRVAISSPSVSVAHMHTHANKPTHTHTFSSLLWFACSWMSCTSCCTRTTSKMTTTCSASTTARSFSNGAPCCVVCWHLCVPACNCDIVHIRTCTHMHKLTRTPTLLSLTYPSRTHTFSLTIRALMPPGWKQKWHLGIRNEAKGNLLAFISAIPADISCKDRYFGCTSPRCCCCHCSCLVLKAAAFLLGFFLSFSLPKSAALFQYNAPHAHDPLTPICLFLSPPPPPFSSSSSSSSCYFLLTPLLLPPSPPLFQRGEDG